MSLEYKAGFFYFLWVFGLGFVLGTPRIFAQPMVPLGSRAKLRSPHFQFSNSGQAANAKIHFQS